MSFLCRRGVGGGLGHSPDFARCWVLSQGGLGTAVTSGGGERWMQVLHSNRTAGKWLLGSLAVWAGVATATSVLIERSRGGDICQGAAALHFCQGRLRGGGQTPNSHSLFVRKVELSDSTLTRTLFYFHVKMASGSDRSGAANLFSLVSSVVIRVWPPAAKLLPQPMSFLPGSKRQTSHVPVMLLLSLPALRGSGLVVGSGD